MRIDWHALRVDGLQPEYYALTVYGGEITVQKAYYRIENSALRSGLIPFDELQERGYLKPFSYGADDGGNEKYDFEIVREYSAVCNALASEFLFFNPTTVKNFENMLDVNGSSRGKIIGAKVRDGAIESVCLYFRTNLPCTHHSAIGTVERIAGSASAKRLTPIFFDGEHAKLYLVATDFLRNSQKIKLYFKFDGKFGNANIAKCFDGNINSDIVKEIADSNAFIEGFQLALSEKTTFNFYLKEK